MMESHVTCDSCCKEISHQLPMIPRNFRTYDPFLWDFCRHGTQVEATHVPNRRVFRPGRWNRMFWNLGSHFYMCANETLFLLVEWQPTSKMTILQKHQNMTFKHLRREVCSYWLPKWRALFFFHHFSRVGKLVGRQTHVPGRVVNSANDSFFI